MVNKKIQKYQEKLKYKYMSSLIEVVQAVATADEYFHPQGKSIKISNYKYSQSEFLKILVGIFFRLFILFPFIWLFFNINWLMVKVNGRYFQSWYWNL